MCLGRLRTLDHYTLGASGKTERHSRGGKNKKKKTARVHVDTQNSESTVSRETAPKSVL